MTETLRRPGFVLGVVLLLVATPVATAATAVAGGAPPPERPAPAATDGGAFQQQQTTPTTDNNSTVRHENPDDADEEGNLTDLQLWLAGQMDDAFVDCARLAQEANTNGTEQTCEALSEEFPSLAAQYAALAETTEDRGDDNVSRVLNRTAERQRAFVRAVREYRTTLAAYREARRQNQPERAQTLARELSRQGDRVETLGEQLSVGYETISRNGTLEVEPAGEVTRNVTANVSETTDEVRNAEFDPPALTVSSNSSNASFVAPATIRGQLRTENGTALANRTIAVGTPGPTLRTRTNADGEFAVTYRPTTAPTGPVTVVATYVPGNDSEYTATTARTQLSVVATEGVIRLNHTPSSLAFGDEMRVRGTLRVAGRDVAGVPVVVTLGGVAFDATGTNESGGFVVSEPLPASVPTGSPTLTVSLAREGRAVTADPASATVGVDRTTPELSVRTNRTDANATRVSGRLAVVDAPVPDAELEIRNGTETLATVTTGENGAFRTDVPLSGVPANGSAVLTVAYDPPGGNLAPVDVRVDVGPAPGAAGIPDVDTRFGLGPLDELGVDSTLIAVGVLALLAALVVTSGTGGSGRIRSTTGRLLSGVAGAFGGDRGEPDRTPGVNADIANADFLDGDESPVDDSDAGAMLLDAAEIQLRGERGEQIDRAVIVAYAAVRRRLDSRFGIDPSLTHWELLARYRDSLDEESSEALERLTAAYERAAFSPTRSTTETADEALKSAGTIIRRSLPETAADSNGADER